jgi:hypothetical protein
VDCSILIITDRCMWSYMDSTHLLSWIQPNFNISETVDCSLVYNTFCWQKFDSEDSVVMVIASKLQGEWGAPQNSAPLRNMSRSWFRGMFLVYWHSWIVMCIVFVAGPPLWSSGQSSWLQIRRPGFDSRHHQKKKSSGSGTGSTQPREYKLRRSYLVEK